MDMYSSPGYSFYILDYEVIYQIIMRHHPRNCSVNIELEFLLCFASAPFLLRRRLESFLGMERLGVICEPIQALE